MATRTFPLPHELIANERLKRRWPSTFWMAMFAATVLHFGLFSLFPAIQVRDISYRPSELQAVDLPPEVKIPPAPAAIARPAVPVVSADASVDPDITIAPTTFADNPVENLPPPPTSTGHAVEVEQEFHMFSPTMTAPELLNRKEVSDAVLLNYPKILRDAGIGGQVVLHVWIDERGSTVKSKVVQGSGQPMLDDAAAKVVGIMHFRPARNRDIPARVIVELPVLFTVSN